MKIQTQAEMRGAIMHTVALLEATYARLAKMDNLRQRYEKLELDVQTLATCIRDGIELNYCEWLDWELVARDILKYSCPSVHAELRSHPDCREIATRKGLIRSEV